MRCDAMQCDGQGRGNRRTLKSPTQAACGGGGGSLVSCAYAIRNAALRLGMAAPPSSLGRRQASRRRATTQRATAGGTHTTTRQHDDCEQAVAILPRALSYIHPSAFHTSPSAHTCPSSNCAQHEHHQTAEVRGSHCAPFPGSIRTLPRPTTADR